MLLRGFRRPFGKLALLAFASLTVFLAVWFVPLAAAHNSLITVTLACNGTASYTANAWAGPTAASRTNSDVRVLSSTDNGSTWTQVGQGQFNQADRYSFSGTFSAGASRSVRVKVQEVANWGDGTKPAPPGTAQANAPSNCSTTTAGTTTTTTTTATPPTTTPTPSTTTATPSPAAPAPSLAIVKTERLGTGAYARGPIDASLGQTVDYRIVVSNTGNVSLAVTFRDNRCDAGTLRPSGTMTLTPGGSVAYTCTHRLVTSDSSPFVNTATASAVTSGGTTVGPVSSTATVQSSSGVLGAFTAQKAARVKTKAKPAKPTPVTAKAKPAKAVVATASFTG